MKKALIATIAALWASAAVAVSPVGSDSFNTDPGFDLGALTPQNFQDVIVPLAKKEGKLTFFDFTNSFGPLFNDHLLPAFEEAYGIKVSYIRGEGNVAVQQLIAAKNAGRPAPSDVYFIGSSSLFTLLDANVIANIPLNKLLPNGDKLNPDIAQSTNGIDHGGVYLPFHRNQTSLVYNSAKISAADMPQTFDDLLAWAQANPGQLIVTSPAKGGSGANFLASLANAKVTGKDCRATLDNFSITKEQALAFAASDCMASTWDYFAALLPVVELTNGNSDTLTLFANGVGVIGTAWEDMAYDFIGRGLMPKTTRQMILKDGQIGGGDGMFLPVDANNPAAGLLFMNFMVSRKIQLLKLQVNGSRSARTDIDPTGVFTPEQVRALVPADEFASRSRLALPNVLKKTFKAYFVSNLLRK